MSASVLNRPMRYGNSNRREYIVGECEVAVRAQNDANGNAIYIGRAKVGTPTSVAKWQISFQAYDANQSLTSKTWPQNADGKASADYEFEWDERASYTYS